MTVATMPPPVSSPWRARRVPISAMIWSPSTVRPFSSTTISRSASPSSAMPISACSNNTRCLIVSSEVDPQPSLMLRPLGEMPIATVFAPNSQIAVGAVL